MDSIFAHGPWYTEWHHLTGFLLVSGASLSLYWYWIKNKFK